MRRSRLGFRVRKIDVVETLRAGALLLTILMAITFFAGCESSKPKQANENSIIKEPDKGHEVHGEVGAVYGRSG
jgi:hypothetical protein